MTLEIAVQDVSGAAAAVASGADRLELCSALAATGGLTPSRGLLEATLAAVPGVGVHPLVRPRPGGFVYAPDEIDVQLRDVRAAVRSGARGVVVGALTPAGGIDTAALERFVEAADGAEVTFHRAFDVVDDVAAAVAVLAAFGVTRVLTSGGAQRAVDGLSRLRQTVEAADGRVQVMAGGGVRVEDVVRILGTGVDAVHLSASRTVAGDGGPGGGGDAGWTTTDPGVVAAARAAVGAPR